MSETSGNGVSSKPRDSKTPQAILQELKKYDDLDQRSESIKRKLKMRDSALIKPQIRDTDQSKHGIVKQLEESDQALAELFRDGVEITSNIRIANDKREVDRRKEEAELREELLEKLQQESIAANAKFSDIAGRWSELDTLRDPMGIYEGLQFQKIRIDDLLRQKDSVIDECRKELELADLRYYLDQEKQNADITCLVERIDNQINIMKRAYREHLELLQSSIDHERNVLRSDAFHKWEELYDHREANEKSKLDREKERSEFYATEIERITREHNELTRATRIRLEKDNGNLQIELENLKGNVLLNSDKLDYNFQVLKRREDENTIIRNQQKRRIARLNETVNGYRHKITELQKTSDVETSKLTEEIMKWQKKIFDLEEKAETMLEINDQKYQTIWKMNEDEGVKLLNKVLAIDKVLYEHQLGLEWTPPQTALFDKIELPSYARAMEEINKNKIQETPKLQKRLSIRGDKFEMNLIDARILRNILRNISDNCGFLIEQKLIDLLQPYAENDKILVRVDNVFNALGITKIENVSNLKSHFVSYSFCNNCLQKYSQPMEGIYDTPTPANRDLHQIGFIVDQYDENDEPKGEIDEPKILCTEHDFVIDPASVLTALREYIENHLSVAGNSKVGSSSSTSSLSSKMKNSISRLLDPNDVKLYWDRFEQVISTQKQNLWNALDFGLQHYIKVLKRREKLARECEDLKRQNNELKFLMQRYMPDNCENELEEN